MRIFFSIYIISFFVLSATSKDSNETKLIRRKRSDCSNIASLEITNKGLNFVSSLIPSKPIEAATSFIELVGSFFGFDSESCYDKIFSKIFQQLNLISEKLKDLKELIICQPINQDYSELTNRLYKLKDYFVEFYKSSDKEIARSKIKKSAMIALKE